MKNTIRLYTLALLGFLFTPSQAQDGFELWKPEEIKNHNIYSNDESTSFNSKISENLILSTLSTSSYGGFSAGYRSSYAEVPKPTLQFYYQDPSVNLTHIYGKFSGRTDLKDGPADKELGIAKDSSIKLEFENNHNIDSFTANPGTAEFDAMHTYAVARLVVVLYKKSVKFKNNCTF